MITRGIAVMPRTARAIGCAALSLVTMSLFLAVPGPAQASITRYYHYEMFADQSGTHHSHWYKIPVAATIMSAGTVRLTSKLPYSR